MQTMLPMMMMMMMMCCMCCMLLFFMNTFQLPFLDEIKKLFSIGGDAAKKLDFAKVFKERKGSNKGEHLFDVHIKDNTNSKLCYATGDGVKCDNTTPSIEHKFSIHKYNEPANGYLLKANNKFCKWDNDHNSQRMLCNQSSPKEGINNSKSMKWFVNITDDKLMSIKNRQTNKYCSLPDGFTDMKCDWDTPYMFRLE